MKRNFSELFDKMKPDAQERVKTRSAELLRAMALADLRRAQARTQQQLAETLNVNQAWISRVERQTDMYLSTLRGYIEALGGKLEVSARFDTCVVRLDHFADRESGAGDMPETPLGQSAKTEASPSAIPIAPWQDIETALLFVRPGPETIQLYGGRVYRSRPEPVNVAGSVSMQGIEESFSVEEDERVTTAA